MAGIHLYVSGSTKDARRLLAKLNGIAKELGYLAGPSPRMGEGSFSRLMIAIANGEVVLQRLDKER